MAGANDKSGKRSKMGSSVQRGVYKSAHAYKHPWYGELCNKADRMNNYGTTSADRRQATLDVRLQAQITRERAQQKAPF